MQYFIGDLVVCTPGNERIRRSNEFVLVTGISSESTPATILHGWLDDMQAHARPANFDYDGLKAQVYQYWRDNVYMKFKRKGKNPFKLDKFSDGINGEMSWEGCKAYLYVAQKDQVNG